MTCVHRWALEPQRAYGARGECGGCGATKVFGGGVPWSVEAGIEGLTAESASARAARGRADSVADGVEGAAAPAESASARAAKGRAAAVAGRAEGGATVTAPGRYLRAAREAPA